MNKLKCKCSNYLRQIIDFPNYFITRDGRVFSNFTYDCELHEMYKKDTGSSISVELMDKGKRYRKSVGKLVLKTFSDESEQMYALTKNGNYKDIRLENLFWSRSPGNARINFMKRKI